jgi:tungstate transport system substrate-binding protein
VFSNCSYLGGEDVRILFGIALLLITVGCLSQQGDGTSVPTPESKEITLSTTTSTENSGLLKVLNPPFEEKYNVKIKVIPEGTGKALKTAELGGSDVVMVHARSKEDAFVEAGYGVNRRDLMHNDFVIIGPASDPAGIKGMKDAAEAFKKIAQSRSSFFSRGDDSGTHTKEKAIWEKAGASTTGTWYKSLGKGMGDTIVAADAQQGYTLTDRATYLSMKDKVTLEILVEGDPLLFNPYGVIAVNPARYPEKNEKYQLVMLYIGYLTSPEGQRIIAEYGKEEFGQALFFPDAIPNVS